MLYKEAEPIEKELAEIVVENGMVYHLAEDGYYYPDINAKQNTDYPVGKYGMMRGEYLMENDRHRYFRMVLDGTWNEYLHGVDEECYRELEMAVKRTKEKEGVTEDLKNENPMLWVGKVNNIMAGTEEEILREIIYV